MTVFPDRSKTNAHSVDIIYICNIYSIQIRRIVFPLTEQSAEHVVGQQRADAGERVRRLRKPPVDQKQ